VVTDSDVHRVWGPIAPDTSRILYLTPSDSCSERLRSYGVRESHTEVTGFPLPPALVGGPDRLALRNHLAARLHRLDPQRRFLLTHGSDVERRLGALVLAGERRPPLLVFAVGGAGAQADRAAVLLEGLATTIRDGLIRLALVAGTRRELSRKFSRWSEHLGLLGAGVTVLYEHGFASYYKRFNALLASADLLWTKPSELVFYGALGLPLLLDEPVGDHEVCNRTWAEAHGATLPVGEPERAWTWIGPLLEGGHAAAAAWNAYRSMPSNGLYRISETLAERGFTPR
jgi:hypothetical protein